MSIDIGKLKKAFMLFMTITTVFVSVALIVHGPRILSVIIVGLCILMLWIASRQAVAMEDNDAHK